MKKERNKTLTFLFDLGAITLATALMAIGNSFFKIPNGFVTGGVTGVGTVLAELIPVLSPAFWISTINIGLLLIGFLLIGRETGLKTAYCTVLFSGFTYLFEWVYPLSSPLTDEPFLELVYAILLSAIGSAVLFYKSASSGGTDIIALIVKKKFGLNVGRALLFSNLAVSLWSLFVFDVETGLLSMFGLFVNTFLIDTVIDSINSSKYFVVITDKPEEVSEFVLKNLHHGVTTQSAVGAFSGNEKTMIHTVCRPLEAIRLRRKIAEVDPHAFTIITTTSEIVGRGFHVV